MSKGSFVCGECSGRHEYDLDSAFGTQLRKDGIQKCPVCRYDWIRASRYSLCTCGKKYYDHPKDPNHNWITVLCSGQRVKL